MIELSIAKLKEFQSLSSFIEISREVSNSMPIVDYFKFEIVLGSCIITKTNYKSFCQFVFDIESGDDCEFLLQGKYVDLICASKSDIVKISIEGELVKLKYGSSKSTCNTSSHKVLSFHDIPQINTNVTRIESDILKSLGYAKSYTGKDSLMPHFHYVYFDKNCIVASSAAILYKKDFPDPLPQIAISKNECKLLSSFQYIDYSVSDNFNTYMFGNVTYGFVQYVDANLYNYGFLISNLKRDNFIKIKKEPIIDFCRSVNKFSSDEYIPSVLEVTEDGEAIFQFKDKGTSEETSTSITSELTGEGFTLAFNYKVWEEALSSIPYEEIFLGKETNSVSVWSLSDESYIGLLSTMLMP